MIYADHRDKIKSGDLLAWSHRGWRTWYDIKIQIVRLVTQSEYSHVGMALVLGGRVWVIESVTPLVRLVPLRNLLPCYHITMPRFALDPQDVEYALSYVGNEGYAYSQHEAIKAYFGANDRTDGALECAEFVKMVYAHAGCNVPGRDVPSDLVQSAVARGGVLTWIE